MQQFFERFLFLHLFFAGKGVVAGLAGTGLRGGGRGEKRKALGNISIYDNLSADGA